SGMLRAPIDARSVSWPAVWVVIDVLLVRGVEPPHDGRCPDGVLDSGRQSGAGAVEAGSSKRPGTHPAPPAYGTGEGALLAQAEEGGHLDEGDVGAGDVV